MPESVEPNSSEPETPPQSTEPEQDTETEPQKAAEYQPAHLKETSSEADDENLPKPPSDYHPAHSKQSDDASADKGQPTAQEQTGTAPLVLGILSIVFSGIIGLVLSIIGMKTSASTLAAQPGNGKAKAGRICSIVGLVLSIIALIAAFLLFTVGGIGIGMFIGETDAVNNAASQGLNAIVKPTDAERDELMSKINAAFTASAGCSLEELGITDNEFSTWLFEGADYSITDTSLNTAGGSNTATVTADVTAHSLDDMSATLASKIESKDQSEYNNMTTTSELFSYIGTIVKESMAETPTRTTSVTLTLTKNNGVWQVDEDAAERAAEEIFSDESYRQPGAKS